MRRERKQESILKERMCDVRVDIVAALDARKFFPVCDPDFLQAARKLRREICRSTTAFSLQEAKRFAEEMQDAAIGRGLLPWESLFYPWIFSRLNYRGSISPESGGVCDVSYEGGKRAGRSFSPPHPDTVVTFIAYHEQMRMIEELMSEAKERLAALGFLQLDQRPLRWVVIQKSLYEEAFRTKRGLAPLQENPRYIVSHLRNVEAFVDGFLHEQEGDDRSICREDIRDLIYRTVDAHPEVEELWNDRIFDEKKPDIGGIATVLCSLDYLYEGLMARQIVFEVEAKSPLFGKKFSDFPNPFRPLREVLKKGYLPSRYNLDTVLLREIPDYLFTKSEETSL